MSEEAEILFERQGAVGLITLNRPKALNALTHSMCVSMKTQLDEWAADAAISTVVVRGAGDRAFCAGGDIRALYESGKSGTSYALEFYRDEYILNATIKHYRKPYLALIHGIDMGGGVGVSVNGTHRIVNETMVFAMPETGIGLFPDVGGSYFLPRCPGETGMYLGLTGARLKTADAIHAGIATGFVPATQTEALVERLAAGGNCDAVLAEFASDPGPGTLAERRKLIDAIFAESSVQEILASLYSDGSDWAKSVAATLRTKSPTSLKIAYRQIREGRTQDFDECMRMEYRMVNRIVQGHDFYEGVRAIIIDKDNSPQWQPARLSEVSESDVDAYFAPLSRGELVL